VCSSKRSFISRLPVRTADAERSRSSDEGGVWTTSSSTIVRRARLRLGAVRTTGRVVFAGGGGADRGEADRAGALGAVAFVFAFARDFDGRRATALRAEAFAALRGLLCSALPAGGLS
jgi:hypothetical protein